MKTKIATVIAMAMLSAPVMAQQNLNSLDSQVFANQNIKAVELSQTEMKETQGEVAPLMVLGSLVMGNYAAWKHTLTVKEKTGVYASSGSTAYAAGLGIGGAAASALAPNFGTKAKVFAANQGLQYMNTQSEINKINKVNGFHGAFRK